MGCFPSKEKAKASTSELTTSKGPPENMSAVDQESGISLLLTLVRNKEKRHMLADLANEEAKNLVEFMDEVLSQQDKNPRDPCLLHTLASLARSALVFPESLKLTGLDENISGEFHFQGKFANTHRKILRDKREVSIKVTRDIAAGQNIKSILRLHAKEVVLRAYLSHPNILPLYGAHLSTETTKIWIISPWMDNGDVLQYRLNQREVSLHLMSDIASGLAHLHDLGIVHGDLRAKNVLVTKTGRAVLTNFEVSRVTMHDPTVSDTAVGEVWWMAPEMLSDAVPKSASDIWAFACTSYELLTGQTPFMHQGMSQARLMHALDKGGAIPDRPGQLTADEDHVWANVLTKCWKHKANERPTAPHICSSLSEWRVDDSASDQLWKVERHKSGFQIDRDLVYRVLQDVGMVPSDHESFANPPQIQQKEASKGLGKGLDPVPEEPLGAEAK